MRCRAACVLGLVIVLGPGAARGATSAWQKNPHSEVRLITAYSAAPRQGEFRLGVQFRLARGWHAYWKNPGSAGYPPKFTFAVPGLGGAETLFPAPQRFDLPGDLVAFGYAEEVVYPLRAQIEAPARAVSLALTADIDYLVCEVECIPYRYDLTVEQPLGDAVVADAQVAALLAEWSARVPAPIAQASGVYSSAALASGGPGALRLVLDLDGVEARPGADLFFESHPLFDLGRPVAAPPGTGLRFAVPLVPLDRSRPLPEETTFAWTLTGLAGNPASIAGESQVRLPSGGPHPRPVRATLRGAILWSFAALAAVAGALYLLSRMRRA